MSPLVHLSVIERLAPLYSSDESRTPTNAFADRSCDDMEILFNRGAANPLSGSKTQPKTKVQGVERFHGVTNSH